MPQDRPRFAAWSLQPADAPLFSPPASSALNSDRDLDMLTIELGDFKEADSDLAGIGLAEDEVTELLSGEDTEEEPDASP
jgi:hypothetical protein